MRTALYAPAHSMALFTAALNAQPDFIIIDLEDSVPADDKEIVRLGLAHLVQRCAKTTSSPVIRINAVDTPWWTDDLSVAVDLEPAAILVPKASREAIEAVQDELAIRHHSPQPVWALIEQCRDVFAVEQIASTPGVTALVIGYGDLCKEMGMPFSDDHPEFTGIRDLILAASRRHHLDSVDGVHFGGPDTTGPSCQRSHDDGFTIRSLYRPSEVDACRSC